MTYNVFGGTLSLTQSINQSSVFAEVMGNQQIQKYLNRETVCGKIDYDSKKLDSKVDCCSFDFDCFISSVTE